MSRINRIPLALRFDDDFMELVEANIRQEEEKAEQRRRERSNNNKVMRVIAKEARRQAIVGAERQARAAFANYMATVAAGLCRTQRKAALQAFQTHMIPIIEYVKGPTFRQLFLRDAVVV